MSYRLWLVLLLMVGLSACQSGIKIEPVGVAPTLVKAADAVPLSKDRVTAETVLHLRDQMTQNALAQKQLADNIAFYAAIGHPQIAEADKDYQRLKAIFDQVHQRSHLADMALKPILIERDLFNAYTLGGLEIVFYTGLTRRLSDDGLAMIIGHEIAHITTGHALEQVSRDIVNLSHSHKQDKKLSGFYAVESEYEADIVGLLYAVLAGYDGTKAGEIWETLSEIQNRPEFNLFTSTHPPDDARAQRLYDKAAAIAHLRGSENWRQDLRCNPIYCAQ